MKSPLVVNSDMLEGALFLNIFLRKVQGRLKRL
jgi:hypothetical protein